MPSALINYEENNALLVMLLKTRGTLYSSETRRSVVSCWVVDKVETGWGGGPGGRNGTLRSWGYKPPYLMASYPAKVLIKDVHGRGYVDYITPSFGDGIVISPPSSYRCTASVAQLAYSCVVQRLRRVFPRICVSRYILNRLLCW